MKQKKIKCPFKVGNRIFDKFSGGVATVEALTKHGFKYTRDIAEPHSVPHMGIFIEGKTGECTEFGYPNWEIHTGKNETFSDVYYASFTAARRHKQSIKVPAGNAHRPLPLDSQSRLYLITIWHEVEAAISGPYKNEKSRTRVARRRCRGSGGDRHGLHRLDISPAGKPEIYAFSGAELT